MVNILENDLQSKGALCFFAIKIKYQEGPASFQWCINLCLDWLAEPGKKWCPQQSHSIEHSKITFHASVSFSVRSQLFFGVQEVK